MVLPLSRSTVRADQAVRLAQPPHSGGIDRLLRIAAARGASTLYLTSHSKPSIRVDGEISAIESEPVMSEPGIRQDRIAISSGRSPRRRRRGIRFSSQRRREKTTESSFFSASPMRIACARRSAQRNANAQHYVRAYVAIRGFNLSNASVD